MRDFTLRPTRRAALSLIAGAALAPALAAPLAADGHMHVVKIRGMAFKPAKLTIAPGDKVQFINEDNAPHTATGKSRSFDTGNLSKNDSKTVSFSAKGRFDYFCAVHPSMTGTIIVK